LRGSAGVVTVGPGPVLVGPTAPALVLAVAGAGRGGKIAWSLAG